MTTSMGALITIQKIDSFDGIDACVHLQQSVWQFPDLDVIPRRMFVVARAVGGQIFGAWDGERLAGFVMAVPGVRNGTPYLHSHMLAVAPQYRNCGIGMRLKVAQREDALARGIDLIEWTFDPLQAKNAYLNLEKLGAIVRRYSPDFYGLSTSPVHGSLPTDRLHAEWWLRSRRVQSFIAGQPSPLFDAKVTISVTEVQAASESKVHHSSPSELELLLQIRRQFLDAFSSGLVGCGFRQVRGGESVYLLATPDSLTE